MGTKQFGSLGILMIALGLLLLACTTQPADDDLADRPVPTPDPTEVPDDPEPEPSSTPAVPDAELDGYQLLLSEKEYPRDEIGEILLELAEEQDRFEELWNWFELEDYDRPDIDWDDRIVLFAGTGESGGCPLFLDDILFDEEERSLTLQVTKDLPPDTVCTADWTPRVFVVALDRAEIGDGELRASFFDADSEGERIPDDGGIIREGE